MHSDIYCNPLQLPDIGPGICCRLPDSDPSAFCGWKRDFREVSDPEMLYHDGRWYMFPSVRQAFVSADLLHWEYHPLQLEHDLGYAPTVAKCGDRFLLTASCLLRDKVPRLYAAPTPLGPYELLGEPVDRHGHPLKPEYLDPSLFCDDDGRLYLYWGSCPGGGICGVELDPENPIRAIGDKKVLITYKPENSWEHYGEYAEHTNFGWNEGVAMFKHQGRYYLQYASCGTNFRHYAVSCYISTTSPLGPFTPPREPMLLSPHGIVNGTGHGGMVAGPNGTVWQFYTCLLRRSHIFERRVGMDRVEFAADGTPHVRVTATPQSLSRGDLGLLPVSVNKRLTQSSYQNDHFGTFAIDDCTHTWWEPDCEDKAPWLQVDLGDVFSVSAARIIWAELNLDYEAGILPEPVKFRLEFLTPEQELLPTVVDMSQNEIERNVEFVTFPAVTARYVRLTILRGKSKIQHGVSSFTVFAPPTDSTLRLF